MTHVMQVCDRTGHTTMTWTDDQVEVDQKFKEITGLFTQRVKRDGYLAYKTDPNGGNAEQIKSFDKTAPKIVLTPPLVGG